MYVLIDMCSIQKQITEPIISGGLVLIRCTIIDLQYIHRCRLQHPFNVPMGAIRPHHNWVDADYNTPSMSQWAQLGLITIGPLSCARKTSAYKSALTFILSSRANGGLMSYVCPLTQWNLKVIPSHHGTVRSWIVLIRSQFLFVLWKILSYLGHSVVVTADS
jgi:hypothetical protein